MKHYDFDLDSKKVYVATLPSTQFSKNPKTHPAASWLFVVVHFLAVANFSFFVAVHFFRSVLCVMTGQRARSIVGRGDDLAKSCTTCTLWIVSCTSCTLYIVPWTLHGCCGQGGSSHQIGPQLNTNLPRFKIFVDTNRTGNDKDKDRECHMAKYIS